MHFTLTQVPAVTHWCIIHYWISLSILYTSSHIELKHHTNTIATVNSYMLNLKALGHQFVLNTLRAVRAELTALQLYVV